MPTPFFTDDFMTKFDSLYRLVIVAARRAQQIAKQEQHGFGTRQSRKPTVIALEEILQGKVGYAVGDEDELS
jgi:DNA-directed RNA polymerase omega subunit